MKNIHYFLFILAATLIACKEEICPQPDLSGCICPAVYDPVCGADGFVYSNSCFAFCAGVSVLDSTFCTQTCPDIRDTLSWPLVEFCYPVVRPDHPKLIYTLTDGTSIYQKEDSTYFRGKEHFLCRCLPPETLIETPAGKLAVADIQEGMEVWTLTASGKRIAKPVLLKNRVRAGADHQVLILTLEDGRELRISPLHPDRFGKPLQGLKVGDELDASRISCVEIIDYQGIETMDILPAGETGAYWANGILVGSTLMKLRNL